MTRWILFGVAGAIATLAACGGDSAQLAGTPGGSSARDPKGATSGGTSNGSTGGIVLVPHTLVLQLGTYAELLPTTQDAAGMHVVRSVTWRSSDPATAPIVADSGVVYGKALGTATIYATANGSTDSAKVIVSSTGGQQQPVSQFNMTVVVLGPLSGTDTNHVQRIAGATVTLRRTGGVSGDTLKTPESAGSALTTSNGEALFTNLAGGSYSIRVTPPSGSPFAEATTSIIPPRQTDISVGIFLQRP
jgi:hypothetical protein